MLKFLGARNLHFILLFQVLVVISVITDSDFFFHLAAGKYIVEHLTIPSVDVFSYTMSGHPWVVHEWLFEVLVYLLDAGFGRFGITVLTSAIATITIVVAVRTCRINNFPLELVVTIAVAILVYAFFMPRPHIFTFLFLSLFLLGLFRMKNAGDISVIRWAPLMMLVWVNMHGGFILGIALLAFFLACEFGYAAYRGVLQEKRRYLIRLGVIFFLTIAASAVNPYFFDHLLFPFHLMSQGSVQSINEWKSPDFSVAILRLYLVFYVLFFLVYFFSPGKPDLSDVAIPLVFVAASFTALRHLPLAVIALTPFLVQQLITLKVPDVVGAAVRSGSSKSAELGNAEYVLNFLILSIVTAVLVMNYQTWHKQDEIKLNGHLPVSASDFVIREGISGNMFNPYQSGGYLIYRLFPQRKVFIDIRADLYSDDIMSDYMVIDGAKSGWEALLQKYAVNYVICKDSSPLRQAIEKSKEYVGVYDDKAFAVFVRNTAINRDLIEKHRMASSM